MAGRAGLMSISDKSWDRLNLGFWAIVAVSLPVILYLYFSGFCFSDLHYLEDKDFIARAIQYNASNIGVQDSPAAIAAYLSEHPNCCAVHRAGMAAGIRSVEVELNYHRKYSENAEFPYYRKYVEITSCGTRGETYGESTKTLKRPGKL